MKYLQAINCIYISWPLTYQLNHFIQTGSSSEDSSSSSSEETVDSMESQDAIVEEALHWLQGVYPEVFSVYINDVEDMSLLNDAMSAIMGHFLGAEREDLTPCIQIAQLVGKLFSRSIKTLYLENQVVALN